MHDDDKAIPGSGSVNQWQVRLMLKKKVAKEGIRVLNQYRLDSKTDVVKKGTTIEAIHLNYAPIMDEGVPPPNPEKRHLLSVEAKVFIDASYEGDLMAFSGADYTVGRESKARYNESLGAQRPDLRYFDVDPYVVPGDPSSGVLPMITTEPFEPGAASKYMIAYNFRLQWVNEGGTPLKPLGRGIDHEKYDLVKRGLKSDQKSISWPHKNYNRRAMVSSGVPGRQVDYPDGDWAARSAVWRDWIDHAKTMCILCDIENPRLLSGMYPDNDDFPDQLYTRMGRRMIGQYVVTQHDLMHQTEINDSIGLGYYAVDIYPPRLIAHNGKVAAEGEVFVRVSPGPYRIPYRALLPKKDKVDNLIVPVCMSASHVAMSSIRMESTYVVMGEAAGVAASHAVKENKAAQDIDVDTLLKDLRDSGVVTEWDGTGYGPNARTHWGRSGWWQTHAGEYEKPIRLDPSWKESSRSQSQDKSQWASQEEWNRNKGNWAWLFPFIDKDHDGKITANEYEAFQQYKKKNPDWTKRLRSGEAAGNTDNKRQDTKTQPERSGETLTPESEMAIISALNKEDRFANIQGDLAKPGQEDGADDVSGEWVCFTTMSEHGNPGNGIMYIQLEQNGDKLKGTLQQLKGPNRGPPKPINREHSDVTVEGQLMRYQRRHNLMFLHRRNRQGGFEAFFTATVGGNGGRAIGQLANSMANYGIMLMVKREALADYRYLLKGEGATNTTAIGYSSIPKGAEALEAAISNERLGKARAWFKRMDKDGDGNVSYQEFPQPIWHKANIDCDEFLSWQEELIWQYNTQVGRGQGTSRPAVQDKPDSKKSTEKKQWSLDEWKREKQNWVWVFPHIDTNGDGTVSAEEYQAFQQYKEKNPGWHTTFREKSGLTPVKSGGTQTPETDSTTEIASSPPSGLTVEQEMVIIRYLNKEDRIRTIQANLSKPGSDRDDGDDVSGEWVCFTTMSKGGATGNGVMYIQLEQNGDELKGTLQQLKGPNDRPPARINKESPGGATVKGNLVRHQKHNLLFLHRRNRIGDFEAFFSATIAGDGKSAIGLLANVGGNYGVMLMAKREVLDRYKDRLSEEEQNSTSDAPQAVSKKVPKDAEALEPAGAGKHYYKPN